MVWLGCGPYTTTEPTSPVPELSSVRDCRAICSAMADNVAAVKNKTECACASFSSLASLKDDIEACNLATDWNFYSSSGLDSHDSDYSIEVTTGRLGDKEYVKPLEALIIRIKPNFVLSVPFLINFGDGTEYSINGNTITYFYQQEGTYQITVTTAIGIATVTGSVDVTIEDVDEGTAGDDVMLNVYHGEESRLADIEFVNVDYATAVCGIRYGETNITDVQLADLQGYVENSHLTNIYGNIGRYRLHVDCLNPYGEIKNDTYFTSRKLDTTFHYHDKAHAYVTPAAGDTEFFNNAKVIHHDTTVNPALRHENSTSLIIEPSSLRLYENVLTYSFGNVDIDTRVINVQNKIAKPEIFTHSFDGAWNLTTNITVRVPAGNNMFLNISFSSGEDQMFYIHYLPYQSDIVFEIMFPALGYYPVQANISNDISYNSADVLVSVEVPIQTISLNVTDVEDNENAVVLLIDLNEGMRGPMKVTFEIDQGNGYVDTYSHYGEKYFFATYRHEYKYPDWGSYDICVRASNRISSVADCVSVQVGVFISYVDVLTPAAGRFTKNETVTTVIRSPTGSDQTYVVMFGDGETFVFTDPYLKATEDFEDTTTSSPTTTSTTTASYFTTGNGTLEGNMTNEQYGGNITTSAYNGTFDANGTTVAPTFTSVVIDGLTTTNQPTVQRRRRSALNGTEAALLSVESLNMTTPSSEYTTAFDGNVTLTDSDLGNDTDINGTESSTVTTTPMQSTTTTAMPTTTTMLPSTMEPIPDDALNPYSAELSTAKRRRDGAIIVTHRYQEVGTYTVKIQVANHFNWAQNQLCPQIIVAEEDNNATCLPSELLLPTQLQSTKRLPLQYYRSQQINMTAGVTLTGCGDAVPTFSWRTEVLVSESGKTVRRPHQDPGVCVLETKENIFKYPRSSLPFGSYVVTMVVSPSGHPLKYITQEFFMNVKPSPPHAVIDGEEHMWFLVYGTTTIKFERSIDPDFNTHDGIEYDLVCMSESRLKEAKLETRESIIQQSTLVTEGITHKYTSKNQIRLYEYSTCFNPEAGGNLTKDIKFNNGRLSLPSEYFVSDVNSFAIFLYVTKNEMTTMAYRTLEIRMSNETDLLAQLDDLLASKDTAGVMRAVSALTAGLTTTNVSVIDSISAYIRYKCTHIVC